MQGFLNFDVELKFSEKLLKTLKNIKLSVFFPNLMPFVVKNGIFCRGASVAVRGRRDGGSHTARRKHPRRPLWTPVGALRQPAPAPNRLPRTAATFFPTGRKRGKGGEVRRESTTLPPLPAFLGPTRKTVGEVPIDRQLRRLPRTLHRTPNDHRSAVGGILQRFGR
jgi:hypothetical protein